MKEYELWGVLKGCFGFYGFSGFPFTTICYESFILYAKPSTVVESGFLDYLDDVKRRSMDFRRDGLIWKSLERVALIRKIVGFDIIPLAYKDHV